MSASTSPQVGGDTGGNPASSSSSPVIIASSISKQQVQPQSQQPLSQPINIAGSTTTSCSDSSSSTATAIHNTNDAPPPQPLFLKPHPTILPTYTTSTTTSPTATPAIGTTTTTNSSTAGASPTSSKSPLSSTTPSSAPALSTATPPEAPSSSTNPHVCKGEGVKEPLPTDVICGRGKMTASHPANRRFRELVDSHKASYQNSKRRDEKTRITCELVDKLRGEGRFVLFDPNTKLWHEVSEEYAREKVSHSLRSRSSTEQRIAHAASNSMKILNSAIPHDTSSSDNMVSIAPRNPLAAATSPKAKSSNTISSTATTSESSSFSSPTKVTAPKSKPSPGGKKAASLPHKKKAKAHKGPSTATRPSKHSVLKPGLDEIVKQLIKDQQKLLRIMIQKETDRFTSAAALGASSQQPRPPMPLSYKAEASAVSKLTASLPKLGDDDEMMGVLPESRGNVLVANSNRATSKIVNTAAENSSGSGDSKKDESQSMSATVTA